MPCVSLVLVSQHDSLLLTIRKVDLQLQERALPDCLVTARYHALPSLEVKSALWCLHGLCDEAERVVFAPLLTACLSAWALQVVTF